MSQRFFACAVAVALLGSSGVVSWQAPLADQIRPHPDLVVTGKLLGNGQLYSVEFYHYKRPRSEGYVRGIRVKGTAGRVLAQKEFEPGLPWFYPPSGLLSVGPPGGGMVIIAALPYGARLMIAHALCFDGVRLIEVGTWTGESIALQKMGPRHQTVVVFKSSDLTKVPNVYTWNGHKFIEENSRFPEFFAKLGSDYARGIANPQPLPASSLVGNCLIALQAFQLAGTPKTGCRECARALRRISSSTAIIPGSSKESPKAFQRERRSAVLEIRNFLSRSKPDCSTAGRRSPCL